MNMVHLRAQEMTAPQRFLPYGRQSIDEDDIAAVAESLRGAYLTTGPAVGRFEAALARSVGAGHAVVCNSGTAALYMAARALGLGAGSRIIVPAVTFLATASAPHLAGADIVFANVDPATGLMRPSDLAGALARCGGADAVFNVHLNGQCGAIDEIAALSRRHGLKIVDDACHALGTRYRTDDGDWTSIGANRFADLSVFSFHPVKTIAMGEGGAVTTSDGDVAERLALIRNHGMTRDPAAFVNRPDAFDADGEANPWYYELTEPGFNWRATDMQCALGLSQLHKLDRFAAQRAKLVAQYDERLSGLAPLVRPLSRNHRCSPAWHLYVVAIDFEAIGLTRGAVIRALAERGVGTQVHYYPVYRQPYFAARHRGGRLEGADSYYARALTLPLYPAMTLDDVGFVSEMLTGILGL